MEPFSLPIKLWISDILTLPKQSILNNTYIFNGRPVQCVDIMGVVISIEDRESFSILLVDDGTGCIKCKVNKHITYETITTLEEEIAHSLYTQHAKQAMKSLLTQTINEVAINKDEIDLGTSVHVIGKIYEFHGNRQLFAISFNITRKVFDEADRIYEMCDLYLLYHNQPAVPHSNILESTG